MPKKHALPDFLEGIVSSDAHGRWLVRKAVAHVKRDRARHIACSPSVYRDAIHDAVVLSGGRDAYTGERLDWHLISQFRNEAAKSGRHSYKAAFAMLPTVDHVFADALRPTFRICSWRTNATKNDLSHDELIEISAKLLKHAGYRVARD